MTPVFKCEIARFPSVHLSQIYDGFEKLRRSGIVEVKLIEATGNPIKPVLDVRVNNALTVTYDTLDGLNWIEGTLEDNLEYFRKHVKSDYYFKRSYCECLRKYAPDKCRILPLGLNIPFQPEEEQTIFEKIFKKKCAALTSRSFEFYPIPPKQPLIILITRLWDPNEVSDYRLKLERESINHNRISYIQLCIKEYGSRFLGGLQEDAYSLRVAKSITLPYQVTERKNYLDKVRNSTVCIATTGLHQSAGWKLGEYVAAARAVVSEPLVYGLPGSFVENVNFLSFKDENELMCKTQMLLADTSLLQRIMNNNFYYYNNFLRPDRLVLNTLLEAHRHFA